MSVRRVALLTAGGFAPCLSSAVGGLIERYNEIDPTVEIIAYQNGYHGLLTGKRGVQVLTNSVLVFANARSNPNLNITLTGGHFRAESESLVGPVAERAINDFNARVAFLGTDGGLGRCGV